MLQMRLPSVDLVELDCAKRETVDNCEQTFFDHSAEVVAEEEEKADERRRRTILKMLDGRTLD